MSKHIPGPWRYVDGYLDCEVWAGNKMVLSYERHPTDEDRANARLMAAAPAMLKALELLLIERDGHYSTRPAWDKARAAVASATEAL